MQFDPLVGRKLGGYRIDAMLGEGGMARVYRGYHERLQRQVAIKVIHPQSSGQAEFQRYFEQEAQLIARLQHRNIVAVYDFGEDSNTHMLYLVMQYVSGGTLREQIVNGQPLEIRRSALYALQMARALHHAHQRGIVHRDVKPLNMLISGDNRMELLLSDFGLAELFNNLSDGPAQSMQPQSSDVDQKLSRMGNITGTPRYMSPEQCLSRAVDARTDIYALGIVLFEMLTGQPPFRSPSIYGLLHQQVTTPPPSIQDINPSVPQAIAQLTIKAMAKAREQRFQTAQEMAQALESWLTPTPYVVMPGAGDVTIPPTSQGTPIPLPPQRKRSVPLARIITLCASLLVVSALLLWQTGLIHLPGTVTSPPGQIDGGHNAICASTTTTQTAGAFVENFQDNGRGWPVTSNGDITPRISNHAYTIDIANNSGAFFLCPDTTKAGRLPTSFTLTAHIAHTHGAADTFYGVVFYFNTIGSDNTTQSGYTGYAFGINDQGTCALFKYSPGVPNGYELLYVIQQFKAIHAAPTMNTLQISVRSNTFTFSVNGVTVPFHTANQNQQSVRDSSYTTGSMGLFTSGPNATYSITQFALSLS
jgi:serine/threonine protein kinase